MRHDKACPASVACRLPLTAPLMCQHSFRQQSKGQLSCWQQAAWQTLRQYTNQLCDGCLSRWHLHVRYCGPLSGVWWYAASRMVGRNAGPGFNSFGT
jgi:hypothetical protein